MKKIWFAGTGNFGSRCLELLGKDLDIDLVITSPPARSGRKYKRVPSPVEQQARSEGHILRNTEDFSEDPLLLEKLDRNPPELIIVVDFGQMIKEPFLSFSRAGCLNIHPSLLPQYRGAAPVQRAIMDGKTETGVTVFRLDQGLDSGPVAGRTRMEISESDTSETLMEKLARSGCELMTTVVEKYRKGLLDLSDQPSEGISYAPKIKKKEAEFNWKNMTALEIHNLARALNPSPGAFTLYKGKRIKVWKTVLQNSSGEPGKVIGFVKGYPVIAALEGSLLIETIQPEGKKQLSGKDWGNGLHLKKGNFLNE
jgi:methionyl-tRNA formyltransferase